MKFRAEKAVLPLVALGLLSGGAVADGVMLTGGTALAGPADDLLPIPGLLRPKPKAWSDTAGKTARVHGGCSQEPLATVDERLPFGPGEIMTWDVSLLGVRTGRVNIRLGERTEIDGETVYPSYASARTTGFMSVLGDLDGRMVSWLDPKTQKPVRMVNRFLVDTLTAPPTLAREDAAFSSDAQVAARLLYQMGDDKPTARPAKLKSTSDLVDVLSVIYYMRSRRFEAGAPFCFEIYHRRRLWRVEGTIGGTRTVSSPFVTRKARLIEGELRLVGGKREPRKVTAWVSDDADRLPLLVETPDNFGTLAVKLGAFIPGRRLMKGL